MVRLRQGALAGLSSLLATLYVAVLVLSVGCPTGEHDGLLHDGHSRYDGASAAHLHTHHDAHTVDVDASASHSHSDHVPHADSVVHAGLCAWSCQANSTSTTTLAMVQSTPLLLADASVSFESSSRSSVIRRTAPSRAPPIGV